MMQKENKQLLIRSRRTLLLASLAATSVALTGCPAVFVGGVAVGILTAVDRRSTGAQVDDQTIELRVKQEINAAIGKDPHINVTSYNRQVLLTGEVRNENQRVQAEAAALRIINVRGVVNALAIGPNTTMGNRSHDTLLASKVKTSLTEVEGVSAGHVKVVSERSIIYLMGIVTEQEAQVASQAAAQVAGVRKVVRLFEIISEEELARISPQQNQEVFPQAHAGGEL